MNVILIDLLEVFKSQSSFAPRLKRQALFLNSLKCLLSKDLKDVQFGLKVMELFLTESDGVFQVEIQRKTKNII